MVMRIPLIKTLNSRRGIIGEIAEGFCDGLTLVMADDEVLRLDCGVLVGLRLAGLIALVYSFTRVLG
jgi:hypothetical protein